MRQLLALPAVLALMLLAALCPAPAARGAELEEALPESTVVLVKVADWAKTRKDIDATALGKILAEEDVKEYIKGVGAAFDKIVAALEKKTGVKSADLAAAYGTELAFAVLGPEPPAPEEVAVRALKANETAAIGSCRTYATAQIIFKRNDWDDDAVLSYARDYRTLASTKDGAGQAIMLIDAAFAAAAGAKGQPKAGYVFQDVKTIGGKEIDWINDYALCATPAEYGKTGKRTFLIDTTGTVYAKDLGKAGFVEAWPADPLKDGWEVADAIGGGKDMPPYVLALIARIGDPAAAGRINATIEAAMKSLPRAEQKPVVWGEVKGLSTYEQDAADELVVYSLRAGAYQLWALSSAEGRVKDLAAALAAGKSLKPLSACEEFRFCRGKLGARADLLWYLGIRKGVEQILAQLPEAKRTEATKVLDALRVGDLTAAAGSMAVEPPGFRSRTFLACKDTEEGIVGLLGREPLPAEFLKLAPANATGLMAGSFRLDRVIPLVRKVAAAVDKNGAAEFDKSLADAKTVLGIDLEKDLFGALTGRGLMFSMPAQAVGGNPLLGQLNGLVIAAEVRDAPALRGAAEKLVAMAKAGMAADRDTKEMLSVNDFDYRGQKITCFNLMMVAPGFAITDKHLIVGGSVQAVKKAISQAGGGEALVDTEAYRKAMAAVETKDAASINYMNLSDSVATAVASVGMISGFAMSAFAGMRQGMRRAGAVSSKNNLRQIGIACHLWADENDEAFPPDLLGLFPQYTDTKKIFVGPGFAKHAAEGVDYAYVAGLRSSDPGTYVLAYEPVAGADGKVNALYIDAHVEQLKLEDLKKALADQTAKLKEAKREMKVVEPKGVEAGAPPAEDVDPELFVELLKALLNPAAMPAPDSFTKHLFPAVGTSRRVEGGIMSESYTPLGFSGLPGLGGGGGGTSVAGISVIAAIAIPSLLASRRSSLETAGVAACRAYAAAQTMFRRNDWDGNKVLEYADDFSKLNTTKDAEGNPIQLIDAAFAAATGPGSPKHGYYFVNMKTIGGAKIDWANDFALCAVPAVYGRTGYRTFIINTNGTTFGIDNGGKPVEDYPADPQKEGWIIAE
ncbi:MAG TPA: DUF2950 family protein [Planctomycetota bacterium]|nr:DUF2950 family protein [Planctomycetota bacterium]